MPQEDADLSSSQILDESLDNTALDNTVLDTTTNADNTIVEEQNDDLPTLDALVYEYERTQRPGVPYDPDECITLLEKFVLFAEAHTTNETVFDIAFRLSTCTFFFSNGFVCNMTHWFSWEIMRKETMKEGKKQVHSLYQ